MPSAARQHFFDKQVHMKIWKDTMSGKNESRALSILEGLGYILGKDFVRQHPIGERFVIDFAFVNEQIAIEIDGESHLKSKQVKLDKKRDFYLRHNNWIPLRFQEKDLQGDKGRFWKNLIREIVEERRVQWNNGILSNIDIPNYNDKDF